MKLLVVRSISALVGAALLVLFQAAAVREAAWVAVSALALAEALALARLAQRHESAATRALLGLSEAMCGLGVALLEPAAILVALAQVVFSVVASGMATVSLSLGLPLEPPRSEPMRRLLSIVANLGLCVIILQALGVVDTQSLQGLKPRDLALLCMALVVVGSARALAELALKTRWTK